MESGIYRIVNRENGKCYIGSAVNLKQRYFQHTSGLDRNCHHSISLQRAWNKYGDVSFSFEVLEYVEDKSNLLEREQYYLDTLTPEYNICKIAGSPLGIKHNLPEETKKRQSWSGRKHTKETKLKMSTWQIGKKLSEETKRKIGLKSIGRGAGKPKPKSEETRKKISQGLLKYNAERGHVPMAEEHRNKIRQALIKFHAEGVQQ